MKNLAIFFLAIAFPAFADVSNLVETTSENIRIDIKNVEILNDTLVIRYQISNLSENKYELNLAALEQPVLIFRGQTQDKESILTGGHPKGGSGEASKRPLPLEKSKPIDKEFKTKLSSYAFLKNIDPNAEFRLQLKFPNAITLSEEGKTTLVTLFSSPVTKLPEAFRTSK